MTPEPVQPARVATGRRAVLLGATAALAAPAIARAQGFPDRPIRLICPWTAGGSTDLQMRAIAEAAGKLLGQPMVVENRPGAGGTLGATQLLQSRPDGYTLAQLPISIFRFPFMQATPGWNPLTDFTYVSHITGYLFGVVVRADSPFQTFNELMTWAKANPGKLTYGTPGVGTSLHITMEQLALKAGVEFLHVPFRGVAENQTALLAGTVMATADSSGWAQLVRDGRLRLLVTWGANRAKNFPDAPTLKELGYEIVSSSPYGFAGPKGMEPAVVQKLDDAFRRAIDDPAHMAILDRFDMAPWYLKSADYAAFAARQTEEEKAMVQRLGLKL
ncbi:tripartite tricarboxylate transporter substrate binding protein [Elioraea rosea]|uniref:tripartite tricarboxylate transporter substrate binding protein n=1 Tax=Elioraea rosea TaxID=2492390 RepID=UPI0011824FB4|nr:tripartite tricarboxylate transporter substrate binding protein [Elioraea rosea]